MSDLNSKYQEVQDKVTSTKNYVKLKGDYDKLKKKAGTAFETSKSSTSEALNKLDKSKSDAAQTLDNLKNQAKSYERNLKSQFEQLLDINNITGGKGSNSISYIKRQLVKTLKNIEPKIAEILHEESLKAVGCDQQQTFTEQSIYIKVQSIDLGSLLKIDPTVKLGRLLYEKEPVMIQTYPFSMNKELYQLIQSGNDYFTDNGKLYNGKSGQPLFNIQYVENDNLGRPGPWFKVDVKNRFNTINNVGEWLVDYYGTIKVFDYRNSVSWILEAMLGIISIKGEIGVSKVEDLNKFSLIIQRILGLCFDNRKEIDVSGVAKLSEYDAIDDSFFELTDIDLRNFEQRLSNIKNGVVEFETCDNVKLPLNTDDIINLLDEINFVDGDSEESLINDINKAIASNPNWKGFAINGSLEAELDLNFVKNLSKGLILSLLSPKVLLPIFTMLKSIGQTSSILIETFNDFMKTYRTFVKNIVSRIGALFVKELFNIIKKDIKNLIQSVIIDLAKEKADKRIIIILKLTQLLITVAQFVKDWRECKSVVDELLWLLKISTSGLSGDIPLPLLTATKLLDGFSDVRAYINTIGELQKIGISTGDMPDGSPNLTVLSMFAQIKGVSQEQNENSKAIIAIPPLTITPIGVTLPRKAYGKGM